MRIVVLCGLPGVGKLAVARELARTHGYRVFHNHLVFDAVEALFPFGSPAFVELRERLWVDLLCRAAQEQVGDVVFTIVRDRGVDANFLVRLVQALSRLGAEVHCMELSCGDAELEQRVASVERSRFGKVRSAERFRELRSAGAFPRFSIPPGTMAIDTSDLSVPQAAASVAATIDRASHGACLLLESLAPTDATHRERRAAWLDAGCLTHPVPQTQRRDS